jgi:hypothetical protein
MFKYCIHLVIGWFNDGCLALHLEEYITAVALAIDGDGDLTFPSKILAWPTSIVFLVPTQRN